MNKALLSASFALLICAGVAQSGQPTGSTTNTSYQELSIGDLLISTAVFGGAIGLYGLYQLYKTYCLEVSDRGATALHYAASEGHTNIVRLLIKASADVNRADNNGATPLHWGTYKDRAEIVRLLIKAGSNVDKEEGHNRSTPLHYAAYRNRTEIVRLLIGANADVNKGDRDRVTPLHNAVWRGHAGITSLLIEAGSDVNKGDRYRVTPLHNAAHKGHTDIVRLFIKASADVNRADDYGFTPLHAAAEENKTEIIRLLIEAGSDVNPACDNGEPLPLHWAAYLGRRNAAIELIARGAKLTDDIKGMQLFQQNPDLLRKLEAVADQRLHAVRDWCDDLEQTKNLPRDVIDHCIVPFALTETQKGRLAEIRETFNNRSSLLE